MKKKIIIVLLISIIILATTIYVLNKEFHIFSTKTTNDTITINTIYQEKTVEGKKLVIKDKTEFNKIIEFEFENDIVNKITIYEQFENKEEYENAKESYKYLNSVNIIKQDDTELYIITEKNDFGTDANLLYSQLYNKYLEQILNAYELVE